MHPTLRFLVVVTLLVAASHALAQGPRLIQRDDYVDRVRGMWLGQCIANWTGLRSEGKVNQPPFLTDDDWGTDLGKGPLEFVLDQDPWLSDDDTDVEYVALHLLDLLDTTQLTGQELAAGWITHMDDDYLWVSNQRALDLMRRGVVPPSTGVATANPDRLAIDAQLTTEFFGALAPGMPREALLMADIPIGTTSRSHAAHASEVFMLLYCFASQTDGAAPLSDQVLDLVLEARAFVPDSSKAADIIDVVVADYLANPDPDDWERTRDLVADRYQANDDANGFRYRSFIESSVNFATGLLALLYGEGDFLRTVQIGTLSGWDSDNGTATMGGLLGLMHGHDALVEQIRVQFPGYTPSDHYDIERTRNNLPDYTDRPDSQDTFTLMADRMAAIAQRRILEAGGLTDPASGRWLLPPRSNADPLTMSPRHDQFLRSATASVEGKGGTVTPWASVVSSPPQGYGSSGRRRFVDGFELDDSGVDTLDDSPRIPYASLGAGQSPGDPLELRVTYDRPVRVAEILLLEGDHFTEGAYVGGWFDDIQTAQVRVDGQWIDPPAGFLGVPTPDSGAPFERLRWVLAQPLESTGIRVIGAVGGEDAFVQVAELDALVPSGLPSRATFDLDANGTLNTDDIYTWHLVPVDLDADGVADNNDLQYLRTAVRWRQLDQIRAISP